MVSGLSVQRNPLLPLLVYQIVFAFSIATPSVTAGETGAVFCTWEVFEADKCASIWLIKRFIDKEATIRIVPKGDLIQEGIPFDTPDAKFRRYHNMSTFESLLSHYELKDPRLLYMGKIIHDIEVNTWERKVYDETLEVKNAILTIIQNSKGNNAIIEESSRYFDRFYDEVLSKRALESSQKQ